jgi:multidrug resistance protein MdtO
MIRAPFSNNLRTAIEQSYALRETVNGNFNQVRALADGVTFEFGPARDAHLAVRQRILSWQPELRMLFVSCITLLKYRLQSPGFELPESVRHARHEFEESLAHTLDGIAARLQDQPQAATQNLEADFARLKNAVQKSSEPAAFGEPRTRLNTFLALSGRITELTVSLDKRIQD